MALLAETYLNCSISLPREDREELAEYLRGRALETFHGVYGTDGEIRVVVEEGSLKIWIEAAAALSVAVAGYGSFRSGIDYLVEDARKFSESAFQIVIQAGVSSDEVDVFQRRLGVVGKIHRVIRKIDRLDRSYIYDAAERRHEYSRLKAILFEIIVELDDDGDRAVLIQNLPESIARASPEDDSPVGRFPRPQRRLEARPEDWDISLRLQPPAEVRLNGRRAIEHQPTLRFDAASGQILRNNLRLPSAKKEF